MADYVDPVDDPAWPAITAWDPNDPKWHIDHAAAVPGYETDPSAVGTNRRASPPDGADQDWRELHPRGSQEVAP